MTDSHKYELECIPVIFTECNLNFYVCYPIDRVYSLLMNYTSQCFI